VASMTGRTWSSDLGFEWRGFEEIPGASRRSMCGDWRHFGNRVGFGLFAAELGRGDEGGRVNWPSRVGFWGSSG